jgi:ketosteroid isomerase-like protein
MPAKDVVSKLFDLWEKGDSAPFFEALAPDVVWIVTGNTSYLRNIPWETDLSREGL